MKILRYAFPQIAGFPHVDHRAEPVFMQVNPRFMGDLRELIANMIRRGHENDKSLGLPLADSIPRSSMYESLKMSP